MKFDSQKICGLFVNDRDIVGQTIRNIHHSQRIVVAQGFGVQDKGIPLRFLSYIVPALRLTKQLPSTAVIEFYFAVNGVLRANRELNRERTKENALEMGNLIQSYVSKIHTDTFKQVYVLFDTEVERGSGIDKVLEDLSRAVRKICEQDENLSRFIKKHGGENALRYMVEHASYMRDPLLVFKETKEWLLVPTMTQGMDHVFMVGGPAEKIFYRLRQALAEIIGTHSEWFSHQFFTQIGSPPTYYYHPEEPFWENRPQLPQNVIEMLYSSMRKVINDFGERKAVLYDLLVLLADTSSLPIDFRTITKQRKKILRGEKIPSDIEKCLQKGWDRLRAL